MSNVTEDSKIDPKSTHSGKILINGICKAKCKCHKKFPDREYYYQASEDLLNHYREIGTMHDQDQDMSEDEFTEGGNQERNRAYIR